MNWLSRWRSQLLNCTRHERRLPVPACSRRASRLRNFAQGRIELLEDRTLLAQVVVLNHVADFPGAFTLWSSSTDNGLTVGQVTYDDFSFDVDTEFNNVAWQGLYVDADPEQNPPDPNTATWRVNIWNDNGFGTGPGTALLSTQNVSAASVNSEFVGFATLEGGIQAPVFNFGTDLNTTFEATADAVYWFSVVSIAAGVNDPVWSWMSGAGPGNGSVQQDLGSSTNIPRAGDRAFRFINDTDDPAPGPVPPTLVEPIGSADDVQPTFSWTTVAAADHYDIWVNVQGSNQLVFRNQNVTGTSFTAPSALQVDQSYIWTVRSVDAGGNPGNFAPHATFTVEGDSGTAAPTLLEPIDTADVNPTFQWSSVAGADHYDIWVNVAGSNELVFRDTNVNATATTAPAPLQAEQRYIWTVRAVTSGGAPGAWATHATFDVVPQGVPPAAAPTIVAPTGTIADTTPAFEWTSVTDADHYDLWVNVLGSNALVLRDTNVSGTTFTPTNALAAGSYIWTVRAVSASGAPSAWATHATFDIAAQAAPPGSVPILLAPTGTVPTPTPSFEWTAVAGATRYDLWVNVAGTNELVFRNENVTTTEFDSTVALTDGQSYIWTARAFVGGAFGDWAEHASFDVEVQIVSNDSAGDIEDTVAEEAAEIDEAMSAWDAAEWWADAEQVA